MLAVSLNVHQNLKVDLSGCLLLTAGQPAMVSRAKLSVGKAVIRKNSPFALLVSVTLLWQERFNK
jgi:hypothetical protein